MVRNGDTRWSDGDVDVSPLVWRNTSMQRLNGTVQYLHSWTEQWLWCEPNCSPHC